MKIVNVNNSKSDIIEFVAQIIYKDPSKKSELVGFHSSMFFDIDGEVTEKTMVSIQKPISLSKIESVFIIKDKKLVKVSPSEFKDIIKKIEKA